jgi:hypothetical protein
VPGRSSVRTAPESQEVQRGHLEQPRPQRSHRHHYRHSHRHRRPGMAGRTTRADADPRAAEGATLDPPARPDRVPRRPRRGHGRVVHVASTGPDLRTGDQMALPDRRHPPGVRHAGDGPVRDGDRREHLLRRRPGLQTTDVVLLQRGDPGLHLARASVHRRRRLRGGDRHTLDRLGVRRPDPGRRGVQPGQGDLPAAGEPARPAHRRARGRHLGRRLAGRPVERRHLDPQRHVPLRLPAGRSDVGGLVPGHRRCDRLRRSVRHAADVVHAAPAGQRGRTPTTRPR